MKRHFMNIPAKYPWLFLLVSIIICNGCTTLNYVKGITKVEKGDYEGAIADSTRAIELNAKAADAYNIRGWAYLKMKRYQDAISDLNVAHSIMEYPVFYDTRGWAFFFVGQKKLVKMLYLL